MSSSLSMGTDSQLTRPEVDLISLRFGRLRGAMPPLGPLSLKASLGAAGISCRVTDVQFDTNMNAFSIESLANWIRGSRASTIGFSVFNDAIPLVIAALDSLHGDRDLPRMLIGGPGVVGIAPRLLMRAPLIEMVVVGEGESVLPVAVREPQRAAVLPGVFSRGRDGIAVGTGRTRREQLDTLPPVDWWSLPEHPYTIVPWSTMRGCPFSCEFCEIIAFMGRKVVARDVMAAIDDLERATTALATTQVAVLDDTFTINKRRVLGLCAEIQRRKLRISFEIFSRADTIDREMMENLSAAGCSRVFFGVDAGDDAVLNLIDKRITIEQMERTLFQAAEFFQVTASFIWGYPFESHGSFQRMLELANQFHKHKGTFPIWPQLHLVSPSAGTPLFEKFRSTLILDPAVETLPMAGVLSANSFRRSFSTILDVVSLDPLLAAPFYRYETPMFEQKRAAVEDFNRSLDVSLGELLIQELTIGEEYATN
jgi:anaerobic magnesium-protoporphyrin IX monomethyl ester cyclase